MPKLSLDQLKEKLKTIKLLSLDVDGVQTTGGLYYTDDGQELRKFNVKDGMGIVKVNGMTDVDITIISASVTPSIQFRGKKLGLPFTYTGVEDKTETMTELCQKLGIGFDQVAHIGDDLNDLPLLRMVGLPITVADGVAQVQEVAHYTTEKRGGKGAVREICDLILEVKGVTF